MSPGPSGPIRGQGGAPAAAGRPLGRPSWPASAARRYDLDAGRLRAGWYSRRVRASAERGRVQGPGRAEADLGPWAVPVVIFRRQFPSGHPDVCMAISRPRGSPPDGSLQGSLDPSPDGSLNPSLNGSPRGWGTCGRWPRLVCAGQDACPATLRWSPPDRFIARRWASFVGPLRAKSWRADDSAGPAGRTRYRAHPRKPTCGYAAIPPFQCAVSYDLPMSLPSFPSTSVMFTTTAAVGGLAVTWTRCGLGARSRPRATDWPAAAAPASTLIVPATRPRRLPCSGLGWTSSGSSPSSSSSHPSRKRPERDRGARRQSTVADRAGGPPASLRRSSEGDQSLW